MLEVLTKSTGISDTKNIGALAPIQFTAADTGKKIIVVEDGKPVTTKNKKNKFLVVTVGKKKFVPEVKNNKGFAAEGRLVFYGNEDSVYALCSVIKKFEKPKGCDPAERAAILAALANTMINEYDIMDKKTGRPLVFKLFSDVNSAQAYVEEKTRKELNPSAKPKSDDSKSLKSGVSSQSEVSEDGNGEPKTKNLYPGEARKDLESSKEQATAQPLINAEKAAEISAVDNLQKWLGKNNHIINGMGLLNQSLSKLRTMIQDEMNSDSSVKVKEKVSFIVDDIKRGFKADIEKFGFHEKYKSAIKDIIDTRLKKDDDEGKFKGITQLVNAITQEVPYLIEECKQANAEFKSKHEVYNDYSSRIDALFDALVANIGFDAKRKELTLARDDWKKSLDEFVPIRGHVKPQGGLSEKIAKSEARVKTEYLALLEKNHSILKEELRGDVKALKDSAENLQVEEGSKIEKDKGQVLEKIATLLKNVDKATPTANENIKKLKEQYNNLSGDIASIKQKLDRQQAEVTFCNTTLFPAMSLIQKKALELNKGNAAACEKGKLLLQIKDKISDIHNNIVSGEASNLTVYIKAAKDCITTNEEGISSYRSQWGSRYFYTMFGVNLKNRVESLHLINKVNQELSDYESKLEPPVAQASL